MLLKEEEIGEGWFMKGDILHFCSVDLIEAPVKYAHLKAIELARQVGARISFDPNVRLPLWHDPEACRRTILEFLPLSDIVKISDEELLFITGLEDEMKAIRSLFVGSVQHVIYTRGAKGASWYTHDFEVTIPGRHVNAVDTTGAGDAFVGSILAQLVDEPTFRNHVSQETIEKVLKFANTAASITTTRAGAISSLPTREEIEHQLA